MKIQLSSLVKFVEDFKLAGKDGVVCFDATILYTTLHRQVQLPSEVNIVRLDSLGMELIYLLGPDVTKHGIPSIIDNVPSIRYRPKEYLYIKGTSVKDGNYILSIHPTNTKCEPYTLQELYAKTYN